VRMRVICARSRRYMPGRGAAEHDIKARRQNIRQNRIFSSHAII